MTLALHDVGTIHARRMHTNQNAAGVDRRRLRVAELQHLGSTEAVENDCLHESYLSPWRRLLWSQSDLHTIPPARTGSLPISIKD
jgi:hypothetical protein